MDQFVAFVCSFLCAAALFGSSGNLAPETQEEDRGPIQGAIVQNKAPSVIGCPVARYPVRFGRDKDANLIDLSAFTHTTVEAMRSWPAPGIIPPANRISPYETTVLALEATLIEYRQERSFDDSDYRLVLADESGRTIIAKISSPNCAVQDSDEPGAVDLPDSRFLAGISSSREEFAGRLSPTMTVERASIHIRVLGIGMFDSLSGQTGEAPNGIQLCPVLSIAFDEERMPVVHAPVPHYPHGGGVRR
jgi:hypothetical protein